MRRIAIASLIAFLGAVGMAAAAPTVAWERVDERPHDPTAFTEGLVSHQGVLLESTGLMGASSVRRVNPRTGRVIARKADPYDVFGEGLTVLRGTAWQQTWHERRILAFSPTTLARRPERRYAYEGWGLTTDGRSLIASDGSSTLRWLDPAHMRLRKSVRVTDDGQPVTGLNELEMIDGAIWANVWMTDRIAIISPADGHVRAWLDLAVLDPGLLNPEAILNGIAIDPVTRLPIVTGKLWPRMYVVRPVEPIPA